MSFNVQRKNLPVWHRDYVPNSEEYVDPFAKNTQGKESNISYLYKRSSSAGAQYLDTMGTQFDTIIKSDLSYTSLNLEKPALIYKGCGLLYESDNDYTNGWKTHTVHGECGITNQLEKIQKYGNTVYYHILWNDGVLTIAQVSGDPGTSSNRIDTTQYTNVPPLVYFEFCAAGGGGAGCYGFSGGGGGGSGASCVGILNFTSETARSKGFLLVLGSSGAGSYGVGGDNPNGDSWASVNRGGPGASGKSSSLRINNSSSSDFLTLGGGFGGQTNSQILGGETTPTGGGGGEPALTKIFGNNSTNVTLPTGFIMNNAVYVLKTYNGKRGGSGLWHTSDTTHYATQGETFDSETIYGPDNKLVLNILPSQGMQENVDKMPTNYQSIAGGFGAASHFGPGGYSGYFWYHGCYYAQTPPDFGGGGGGSCEDGTGATGMNGAPGAYAGFKMYWVPTA